MSKLLLIDAYAIIHRAFFALPELTSKNGTPTNAVYGFFTMIQKVINDFQPTHVAICFDTPKPTFRKLLYKEYQAHRPKAVDGFKVQIPLIKNLIDVSGLKRIEKEGFEADDVIGTLSVKFKEVDQAFILTGDKDMMQLITPNVFIISPHKGISSITIYGPQEVYDRFGIEPKLIADFKALMGDQSDNYKGAKGIGPKTAAKLLQQFKSVEHLLEHTKDIEPQRIRELIEAHVEDITISKKLATILTNVELDCTLEDFAFTGFRPQMKDELQHLQLYSLMGRLFGSAPKKEKPELPKEEPKKDDSQLDLFG